MPSPYMKPVCPCVATTKKKQKQKQTNTHEKVCWTKFIIFYSHVCLLILNHVNIIESNKSHSKVKWKTL